MFVDALVLVGTLRVIERVEFAESGEFVLAARDPISVAFPSRPPGHCLDLCIQCQVERVLIPPAATGPNLPCGPPSTSH